MDPGEFLRRHPPFDRLPGTVLSRVEDVLEVQFVEAGSRVLERSGPVNQWLYVIRKGSARLEVDGRSLELLEEGEPFGYPSLLSNSSPSFDVVADEECLLYRIPKAVFDRLMEERTFADFFLKGIRERLQQATNLEAPLVSADLTAPVRELVGGEAVMVDPEVTVAEAARTMSRDGVSSVLVRGVPLGIVTDRDLRNRVLARDLPSSTPVGETATRPAVTLPASASLFEALALMLERRIHHVPLEEDGRVIGVITDTDLLRRHLKSPFHLLKEIERANGSKSFAGYGDRLSGMVEAMVGGGVDAVQIGRVVATLNDSLAIRVLRRAEQALGPPPTTYAWIVFGSEGRREQALITDQDNAIVFAEDSAAARDYFPRLAEVAVQGLIDASFPPCKGGFMATNWCRPLAEWEALFRGWIERPEPEALVEAANFFDFRAVHGALSLEPLESSLLAAGGRPVFIAHLARAGLRFQPPLGLFRNIREEDEGVDLKKGGLLPVVSLARVLALEARSTARGTLERLDAARAAGKLSQDGAELLGEAYRFLLRLRLSRQLAARRGGRPVTNHVALEELGPGCHRHLKEAFRAIRRMQEAIGHRLDTDLLG